jgi:hypothetical protein
MSKLFRPIACPKLDEAFARVKSMSNQELIELLKKLIEFNLCKKQRHEFVLTTHKKSLDLLNSSLHCQTPQKKQLIRRIKKMELHINIINSNIHIFQNKLTRLYHKVNGLKFAQIEFIKNKIDTFLSIKSLDIFNAVNNMFRHIVHVNKLNKCFYQDDEWYLFNQTECIGNPTLCCCLYKYDIKITLYNKSFKLITITLNELYLSNPHIIHKIMLQGD